MLMSVADAFLAIAYSIFMLIGPVDGIPPPIMWAHWSRQPFPMLFNFVITLPSAVLPLTCGLSDGIIKTFILNLVPGSNRSCFRYNKFNTFQ